MAARRELSLPCLPGDRVASCAGDRDGVLREGWSAVPGLSARSAPRPEESPAQRTLVAAAQPIPRGASHCSKPARRRCWPYADHLQSPAPAPVAARPRHRARRACSHAPPHGGVRPAPSRRRPSQPAPPRAAHARAGPPAAHHRGAEPLGTQSQRLGQPVLQRRRALDELELAQLPLRLVRPQRAHDGRQAAARPLGPGAFGPGVRLSSAEHPRAAGAHGRGERRAGLRPDAAHVGPRRPASSPGSCSR